jgi:undecaprenyl-diphosphatase
MLSHTGKPMAVASCVAVVAALVYPVLWLGWWQGWRWLHDVDMLALNAAHDIAVEHPVWVQFWQAVCAIFGPTVFRLLGAVVAVAALVARRLRAALFLVVSVQLCALVTRMAKGLATRPRPATALVAEPSWSFPSGHALTATVGVLALLTLAVPVLCASARMAVVVVGALIVVAVGVGRVALNVHHPSDVLAGWALGYLYFLACLVLVRPRTLA